MQVEGDRSGAERPRIPLAPQRQAERSRGIAASRSGASAYPTRTAAAGGAAEHEGTGESALGSYWVA